MKGDWRDLIAQFATYGRAILNAHPSRTFALGIAFNHVDMCARFVFFHRGGVHSTPAFDLNTNEGVDGFIHGVCITTALQQDLCSWTLPKPSKQLVLGSSQPKPPFPYHANKYVYKRVPMTGRCTAVWLLEPLQSSTIAPDANVPAVPMSSPSPAIGSEEKPNGPVLRSKRKQNPPPTRPTSSAKRRKRSGVENTPEVPNPEAEKAAQDDALQLWHEIQPILNDETPEKLLVKDTWAPEDHATEGAVHKLMSGEFGAPKLWGHQVLDSNHFFFDSLSSTTDWHIFTTLGLEYKAFYHNKLVHLAMYFTTIGESLEEAKTVRELLVAVLHAMLGGQ